MYKKFCDVCNNEILDENPFMNVQTIPPKGGDFIDFSGMADFCGYACLIEWASRGGKTS